MNKKIISILIVIVMLFYIAPKPIANAAIADIALAAGAAYMVANASGMAFLMDGPSGISQSYMEQQITDWLKGDSITEVFGKTIAKKIATKMIIPTQAYNAVKDFLNYLKDEKKIGTTNTTIGGGTDDYEDGLYYDALQIGSFTSGTFGIEKAGNFYHSYWNYTFEGTSYKQTSGQWFEGQIENYGYKIQVTSDKKVKVFGSWKGQTYQDILLATVTGEDTYLIKASAASWDPPDVDIGYQWEGNLTGAQADTNLSQLLRQIFTKSDANDITVTGEVTEAEPEPTPEPTTPPAEDILEGINDIIGQLDNIKEGVGEVTGSMTETIEGTAEAVESIEGTLSDAFAMPDSEELPDFKFDLRELFPFCIPFDIYNLLSRFDANPTAPHVQIPFTIPSINFEYSIDLDFSAFDSVAAALRMVEFIVYAIGLALVTGKVIKW